LAIARRALLPVGPSGPVAAELGFLLRIQRRECAFIGIEAALPLIFFVGADPGWSHLPRCIQRGEPLDIHLAPDASLAPRRETDGVGLVAERFADPVNPAKAQSLVARLRPVDRRLARALLPQADEQIGCGCVVGGEPGAELGFCGEKARHGRPCSKEGLSYMGYTAIRRSYVKPYFLDRADGHCPDRRHGLAGRPSLNLLGSRFRPIREANRSAGR